MKKLIVTALLVASLGTAQAGGFRVNSDGLVCFFPFKDIYENESCIPLETLVSSYYAAVESYKEREEAYKAKQGEFKL